MKRITAIAAVSVLTAALTGCQSANNYVAPNLSASSAAIITGSKSQNPDPTTADTRVYLVAIDDKLTLNGPHGWDDRTVASPGPHNVRFAVSRTGAFGNAWGFGSVQTTLQAGRSYVLRATEPVEVSSVCANSTGWIEDDGGNPVSQRTDVIVGKFTGVTVPIGGGGVVSIPSHTRCSPS